MSKREKRLNGCMARLPERRHTARFVGRMRGSAGYLNAGVVKLRRFRGDGLTHSGQGGFCV